LPVPPGDRADAVGQACRGAARNVLRRGDVMTPLRLSTPVLLLAVTTTACSGTVVTTQTVSGTVLDADGAPLPGAPLLVEGVRTRTDAAGRFSVADVAIPYDVSIVEELAEHPAAHVYFGMSDPAPTYRMMYVPGRFSSCTLTVTFPTMPTPTLDVRVLFEVPD